MTKRVYIVSASRAYAEMFLARGWLFAESIEDADLIQFTGGEDVSPPLYGQEKHKTTYNNLARDKHELGIFYEGFELDIPMTGICRGGQFLFVANGGQMYQDVDNHCGEHMLHTYDPTLLDGIGQAISQVTSTHHQMMMYEGKFDANVVAVADGLSTRREFYDEGVLRDGLAGVDLEVVHFPETKCLCFQPHPEFYDGEMQNYYFKLLSERLKV
jgi:hypothetical protein